MLKNKFKIITILVVLILLFTVPIVRAENETTDDTNVSNTTITEEGTDVSQDEQELLAEEEKNDVYLVGDDVVIDHLINRKFICSCKFCYN